MEAKPRVLLAVYRFHGLEQLVRIEKTYGKIYGLVLYDELIDIAKFVDSLSLYG